jgi:hypothetical protein
MAKRSGPLKKHENRPYAACSHFCPLAILVSLALLVSSVSAQQEEPSQQEPSSAAEAAANSHPKIADEDTPDQSPLPNSKVGTSDDRLFNLLPNFLTLEDAGQRPPLTTDQKFKVVARSSFDYVIYPWYGLLAGISQAQNSEAG